MPQKPEIIAATEEFYRRRGLDSDSDEFDPDNPAGAANAEFRAACQATLKEFESRFVIPLLDLRALPTDCLLFANGYGHLIGCQSQKDIVTRHRQASRAKANVSKYVKKYSRTLGVQAGEGQRDREASNNMRQSRKRQLNQHP